MGGLQTFAVTFLAEKKSFFAARHALHDLLWSPTKDEVAAQRRERPSRQVELSNYSSTSWACARIEGGTVMPSCAAVLRFTTRSNRVGCSTGRSPALSPLRILPT